jgi:hypothetical protein
MASINPFQIISHEQYPAALEAFGRLGLPDPMP